MITIRQAAYGEATTGQGTPLSVSARTGDLLVLITCSQFGHVGRDGVPSGWTSVYSDGSTSRNRSGLVAWSWATGPDDATNLQWWSTSPDNTSRQRALLLAVSGVLPDSTPQCAGWQADPDTPPTTGLVVAQEHGTQWAPVNAFTIDGAKVVHPGVASNLSSWSTLRALLTTIPPGTRVTLGVERDGAAVEAHLTTINPKDADGDGNPDSEGSLLGLVLSARADSDIDATFGLQDVGGPSAGSMFALGIIDALTPGDMTGGKDIAGTGTIEIDGQVGAIGGIRQKMAGARAAGSDYFLAPASNCSEVVGHEPRGMEVFAVSTLHEAVGAVEAIAAGDTSGLATCETVVAAPSS